MGKNLIGPINVRMTYAFRCIGEEAAKTVCALMNMPQPAYFKR